MKCVVLVGGEGTRLRPLTFTTPKQMLPIVEMTMIERVILHLKASGIDEAILSLGYKPDVFADYFPDGSAHGVRLVYAVEPEPLDTAGAIGFAAACGAVDETFVVVNGDVLTDAPISQFIDFHRSAGAEATIALTPVEDPSAFGVVEADSSGRVVAFIEKPPPGEAPTNLINAGTYVLEPSVLDRIEPGRRVSIEREVFPAMAASGTLYADSSESYWLDTGTPEKYLEAHADLLSGRRSGPPNPHARSVGGGVWVIGEPKILGSVTGEALIGTGAEVGEGSVVDSSTIGHGSIVEGGVVVRSSVVLPGAHIESGAVVENSIVGPRARIGRDATIEAVSVIGADMTIGNGEQLSAARVPLEDTRQ